MCFRHRLQLRREVPPRDLRAFAMDDGAERVDRLAGDLAAIDEEAPLGALEEDAVARDVVPLADRPALGGAMPRRETACDVVPVPPVHDYAGFALQAGGKPMSTTMAFVRVLGQLLKDPTLGPRIVPIVADEARTFGMANLFKQVGIYSCVGQKYAPEDIGSVLSYREAKDGQILEEGISEAGAIASWTAAATSYSVHGVAMLPFYIYYSVFGFQRVGDQIWAAADQRARGFLIGATSGRTTLAGEGLQHQDGSSALVAATIPNCHAFDPAFAQELAVIVQEGMHEMLSLERDVFYYITLTNESLPQLAMEDPDAVLRGMHCIKRVGEHALDGQADVRLLASGPMVHQALLAAQWLAQQGFTIDVFSVTSWSRLAREGMQAERLERVGDEPALANTWLSKQLGLSDTPIIAVSDYVRAVPEQIRAYLPQPQAMTCLGTDGFGRSDTRSELRDFFEVSARWIAQAALVRLQRRDLIHVLFAELDASLGGPQADRRQAPWEH